MRKHRKKLLDIDLGNDFLKYDSKITSNKAQINKQCYLKLKKTLPCSKETIDKIKRQHMGYKKLCANHVTDKELISKNI